MASDVFQSLISDERTAISMLRQQIRVHERRLVLLQQLISEELQPSPMLARVPSLLPLRLSAERSEAKVSALDSSKSVGTAPTATWPKGASSEVLAILAFIGTDGKSLDDIEAFSRKSGFSQSRHALTSLCSIYTIRHSILKRKRQAFFYLTSKGVSFLKEMQTL